MAKKQEYLEHFLKKVMFLECICLFNQQDYSMCIQKLTNLIEYGTFIKIQLRIKCLELLKKSIKFSKVFTYKDTINHLIDFYTKTVPSNIVVIIKRSPKLIIEYKVLHAAVIKIIRSLVSKDKFNLFSFGEQIDVKFQKNCGYYTNYIEIESDINKILNNIRNMSNDNNLYYENFNIFKNIFDIVQTTYKSNFNNFYFFFLFDYQNPSSIDKDWRNFHFLNMNKDIKKLEDLLNQIFLSFFMICPIHEKIKREKIISVLKLTKRNYFYDYSEEESFLCIQEKFKLLLKSFLLSKN